MFQMKSRASFGKEYAAYKTIFKQADYITRHRIYNRLLELLSNPRIRRRLCGEVLPFVLHEQTKAALLVRYGFSQTDISKIEAAIFDFATHYALDYEVVRDAPKNLYSELRREGREDLIFDCRIVGVPNFILNALVCESLEKEFSRSEILTCGGFVLREGYLRLDLDEQLTGRGFMMPVKVADGLITALKVFRYPVDERPFILKSRSVWGRKV